MGVNSAPQHGCKFVRIGKGKPGIAANASPSSDLREAGEKSLAGADAPVGTAGRYFLLTSPGQQWPGRCRASQACAGSARWESSLERGCRVMLVLDEAPATRRELHGAGAAPLQRATAALCSLKRHIHPMSKQDKIMLQRAKRRGEGGRGARRRWLQPKENALEFI